jgi:hypothetical protein
VCEAYTDTPEALIEAKFLHQSYQEEPWRHQLTLHTRAVE